MTNNLDKAKGILGAAFMDNAEGEVSAHVELANAYTAFAQAEALERIAVALEKLAGCVQPLLNNETTINAHDTSRPF